MKSFRWIEPLAVAAASLTWFFFLIPWGGFPDPDAFYHAHMTDWIMAHGVPHTFPWLDLTTLGTHFADQHLLYHLILIPFVSLFGAFRGTQILIPLLATGTILTLWWCIRVIVRDESRYHDVWLLLPLLVPAFSVRMVLGKASPIAVALFLLVIAAMLLKRPRLACVAGLIFALSHGGWIIAILGAGAMLVGEVFASHVVHHLTPSLSERGTRLHIKTMLPKHSLKTFFVLLLGILAGILLHPNRHELLSFLWIQIIRVSVPTASGVPLGLEWTSPTITSLITNLAPLLIALLLGVVGVLFAPRRDTREASTQRMRTALMLVLPVALTFALTVKSYRMIEYFVPVFTLWIVSIWQLVDVRRLWDVSTQLIAPWKRRVIIVVLVAVILALTVHHTHAAWASLRDARLRPFNAYATTFHAIRERANPGDRVFHSAFDEFPTLFALDDRLKYLWGLDPTFLYEASSTLGRDVTDLVYGDATSTAWNVIAHRTGSRFVFVTTKRHPIFDATLQHDPRFKELARDRDTAAYEVMK
jgi:hypothetical protein